MKIVAVLIADDHPLIIDAVKNIFKDKKEIEIIGEASNGGDLLRLVETTVPDIAIVDLEMPGMNGYDTILKIHTLYPQVKTIAFSGFLNDDNQQRAINMGACGSISKGQSREEFIKAFEAVVWGNPFHTRDTAGFYVDPPCTEKTSKLTMREQQILMHIAQGKTSREISEVYTISPWTVAKHRSNIKEKMGFRHLAEMVKYAIENF
ncbi:MAG: response regulator transcription factor [Desulfobacteraceae bacterium]